MSNKSNFDEPQIYTIPPNFAREGTLLNGTLKLRNTVEAAVIGFGLGYLISLIPIPILYLALIEVIVVLPLVILALVGFNDSPLTVFILDSIKYLLSNKKLEYYSFGIEKNNEEGGNK